MVDTFRGPLLDRIHIRTS